ncbi:MAG TPA: hypothetical protein VFR67_21970 [Pilimelia sp.]|nr:hypothetical protein [Pilimelia sp.]
MAGDDYHRLMRELAEAGAQAQQRRDEVQRWYDAQCRKAAQARTDAERDARNAAADVAEAEAGVGDVDAEAAQLWSLLGSRTGAAGRRLGEPPAPTRPADPAADPHALLDGVRDLLDEARQARPLPGRTYPLLALFGLVGAGLAAALAHGLRVAAHETGGDLGVGLPVVALIVALLGSFAGLVPAKRLADRRGATLDAGSVGVVVVVGLATAGGLLVLLT